MTVQESPAPWSTRPNPFPRAAIATVDGRELTHTIETEAVKQVRRQVDAYLKATTAEGDKSDGEALSQGSGAVMVIAGEYGTGKTHLALEILAHLDKADAHVREFTTGFFIPTPGSTLTLLYRELMVRRFLRPEVVARVRELYAEVVFEELEQGEMIPPELLERLKASAFDPVVLVDRLALIESALLDGLRERLRQVTEKEVFATALALLIRPRFEEEVWLWLCGEVPSPALRERGIETTLADDPLVLEALGVVALLHGRRGRRFVLVVDEMEKLMLSGDRATTVAAVKRMLETFRKAGALLACCGLPEIFNLLPEDTGRIEPSVYTSPLESAEVVGYIRSVQSRQAGEDVLEPFDEDVVDLLVQLTGGVAREVIKLCYACYDAAAAARTMVTPEMVRDEARSVFTLKTVAQVRDDVRSALKMEGFVHRVQVPVPGVAGQPPADFWIPFSEHDEEGLEGCAVYVTDPVLDQGRVADLIARAHAVRSRSPRREAILVCSGYVKPATADELTEAFSTRPVLFDPREFLQAFSNALAAVIPGEGRAGDPPPTAPLPPVTVEALDPLLAMLERMQRQQTETRHALDELSERWERGSIVQGSRLDALHLEFIEALQRHEDQGANTRQPVQRTIPPEMQVRFDRVLQRLDEIGDTDYSSGKLLEFSADSGGAVPFQAARAMRSELVYSSIGVAVLLRSLVDKLRTGLSQLAGTADPSPGAGTPAGAVVRYSVINLCDAFDAIWRMMPMARLDEIAEFTNVFAEPQTVRRYGLRIEVQDSLEELSREIRDWVSDPA